MGIYDRSYYRGDQPGTWLTGRSMVINLILLNVVIYVVDVLASGQIGAKLALQSDLATHPWKFWQLLSYGFIHDQSTVAHVLFNMFGLWVFGTDVEGVYGRAEFLRFYLVTMVVAGLVWAGVEAVNQVQANLIGASGGVMGVIALYIFNFPRRILYIWGLVPVPAWALGAIYLVFDLMGAANPGGSNVANVAHLAGMAFGFVYFKTGLNLGHFIPSRFSTAMFRWKPKLRIHDPEQDTRDLGKQVDEILEKISQQGEASLTKKERQTLEEASRRYQRRRS
jgi:membrane associated rhomboid family serine protease